MGRVGGCFRDLSNCGILKGLELMLVVA